VADGPGRTGMTARPVKPGDRYGKLVVERVVPGRSNLAPTAICRCDCGNKYSTTPSKLRRGRSAYCAHCSMLQGQQSRHTMHIGDRIGELTVIGYERGARTRTMICECTCGHVLRRQVSTLRKRKTEGCKHKKPDLRDIALGDLFRRYARSADRRGLTFELTLEQFRTVISAPCYYCGAPPSGRHYSDWKRKSYELLYSGVDRADAAYGYALPNCRPCCSACNYAKGTMTATEYIEHCARVMGWSMYAPRSVFD
jgi:hypothetical protein